MSVNFREEDPAPTKEVDDPSSLASYCRSAINNHQSTIKNVSVDQF
jgi:hypothetical protein